MPAVQYTHTTLAQARQQLAALLDDPRNIFWSADELNLHITEAIRTFGGFSYFFRQRGGFQLQPGVGFYDLPALSKTEFQMLGLRSFDVTDQMIVNQVQYALLEPVTTGNNWTGTTQYTLSDITQALYRRVNQFLFETACTVTRVNNQPTGGPPVTVVNLPTDYLLLRRVAWQDSVGTYTVLYREDNLSADAYNADWMQNAFSPPVSYLPFSSQQLQIQLCPPPQDAGTLEFLYCKSAPDFSAVAGTPLPIPNDFTWAIKFGVLASLFSKDGECRDPQRAQYCEERFQEGVRLARFSASVLNAQLLDRPIFIDALHQMDLGMPNWMNFRQQPHMIGMAGLNLAVFGPLPDQQYQITLDLVRNAIVPATDSDYIQVGPEELSGIIAYAKHLAALKMGGQEFAETVSGYQSLLQIAARQNAVLRANARDFIPLTDRGDLELYFRHDKVEAADNG